jgi:hypothetical protein
MPASHMVRRGADWEAGRNDRSLHHVRSASDDREFDGLALLARFTMAAALVSPASHRFVYPVVRPVPRPAAALGDPRVW